MTLDDILTALAIVIAFAGTMGSVALFLWILDRIDRRK